jgi:hypothetical protein
MREPAVSGQDDGPSQKTGCKGKPAEQLLEQSRKYDDPEDTVTDHEMGLEKYENTFSVDSYQVDTGRHGFSQWLLYRWRLANVLFGIIFSDFGITSFAL